MTFSEKLKALRKEKGETQKEASDNMGIGISSLRNYENGRFPETEQLRIIQQYYNVPYEYLLNDDCLNKSYENLVITNGLKFSDECINTLKEYQNKPLIFYTIEAIIKDKNLIKQLTQYLVTKNLNYIVCNNKSLINFIKTKFQIPAPSYSIHTHDFASLLECLPKSQEKISQDLLNMYKENQQNTLILEYLNYYLGYALSFMYEGKEFSDYQNFEENDLKEDEEKIELDYINSDTYKRLNEAFEKYFKK